jgi:hypothetical protein
VKVIPPSQTLSIFIAGVRVYRDDLERMVATLTDAGFDVSLSDGEFIYVTLDELQTRTGGSPSYLSIRAERTGSFARVSMVFSGRQWHVDTTAAECLALGHQMQSLLLQRQTRVAHMPIYWVTGAALCAVPLLPAIAITWPSMFGAVTAMLFTLIVIGFGLGLYWRLFPKILLRYRHEGGYLTRNRDNLASILFGGILAELLRWIVSRF